MVQRNSLFQTAIYRAKQVLYVQNKRYLDDIANLSITKDAFVPDIRTWQQLLGYRTGSNFDTTKEILEKTMSQWLRSSHDCGVPCAILSTKKDDQFAIYYGGPNTTVDILDTHIPDCSMQEATPSIGSYRFSGAFLGTITSSDLNETIAASTLCDVYCASIFIPVADSELKGLIAMNRNLESQLKPFRSWQQISGTKTTRTIEFPVSEVISALAVLKDDLRFLEETNCLTQAVIRFGANTREEFYKLGQLIQGCLRNSNNQQVLEPVRHFEVFGNFNSLEALLAIPSVSAKFLNNNIKSYALSLENLPACASTATPPVHSYPGFYVTNNSVTENCRDIFPLVKPLEAEGLSIGNTKKNNIKVIIPWEKLLCHTAILGSSGSGKTTLIKQLLKQSWSQKKLPFVVLEAAKKEYYALAQYIPELQLLTPGLDGPLLAINPLQPEDGTAIEKHVAAIVRALISTSGAEHPLPEAFSGLLKQVYANKGWDYGTIAYTDHARPWPVFKDVLDQIDNYVEQHAHYGPEVKQNLTAALKLRCDFYTTGVLGRAFQRPFGITAKELFARPTIIELADYDTVTIGFIMNILLFKLQSYLEHLSSSDDLNRLIIVEEAHNVFRKTTSEDSSLANSNLAFEKMLAEIRASGTGIIISDQRPSILSDAILANTAVKIGLALDSEQDRKAFGDAIELSNLQRQQLRCFNPGEGLVALRGQQGVSHLQLDKLQSENGFKVACLFCNAHFRCREVAARNVFSGLNTELAHYHLAKLKSNRYNPMLVIKNIDELFADLGVDCNKSTKLCLLGKLLELEKFSLNDSRIILNTYYINERI